MGGSSSRTLDTVPRVDVPKLMGAWFVIATMPTPFEKGAHNAIETYTMGKGAHCVDVDPYPKGSSFPIGICGWDRRLRWLWRATVVHARSCAFPSG